MLITNDTKESIKSTFKFFTDYYKILIGNFLTLNVPKYCNNQSCTIMENIYDTTLFHQIALYINGLNFLIFILMFAIEIKREKWCILKLDQDTNKSMCNLDTEIEQYPKLKKEMKNINKKYFFITKICVISQIINISISVVDIYYKSYGFRSFTPFTSYIMVILYHLYNSYNVYKESLMNERVYSSFLSEPKNYNSIDADYKKNINII